MGLYISLDNLQQARKQILDNVKKPDTFAGIVMLLLSSAKIQNHYYQADMGNFANIANLGFTLKDVRARITEKSWYALFTPMWANRALTTFLNGKPINIYALLATIFWYKDENFIEEQKNLIKELIGSQDFNILFVENRDSYFTENMPVSREQLLQVTKGNTIDGGLTIKYDDSFIVKDAGDLSASPFSQTLYSGLEIKQLVNIFDFNIIGEFDLNAEASNHLPPLSPFSKISKPIPNISKKAQNLLLYGVAGVGKSFNINKITGENHSFIERIVFHPDYLNTDFIGQILPTVSKDEEGKNIIEYQFKAGSFTKILKEAFANPSEHYYLVIEEINRGNAPAIFGEVFQLLDRKADGSSTYRISHDLMAKEIFNDPNQTIYIPSNLTILATMNTADQNVFTLDTAFQRRWTMRMIENDINNCDYRTDPILDTGVSWEHFNNVLNEFILEKNKDTLSSEDKRLGAFFVRQDELAKPTDENEGNPFAEKVIKYLWDDVFKFNKSVLFNGEFNSLDKVLRKFKQANGFNRFDIFNNEIRDKLKPLSPPLVQSQPSLTDNDSDGE